MKITWLGHACFKMESNGYSVVIDPFKPDMLPWLPEVNTTWGAAITGIASIETSSKTSAKQIVFFIIYTSIF